MKRKFAAIALTMILVLGISVTAHAERDGKETFGIHLPPPPVTIECTDEN